MLKKSVRHAGKERVRPNDLINARVDLVLGNDVTAPVAIKEFERIGVETVFDRDRIALVPDHFTLIKTSSRPPRPK